MVYYEHLDPAMPDAILSNYLHKLIDFSFCLKEEILEWMFFSLILKGKQ